MSKNNNTTEQNLRAPIVTIMGHVDHGKTSILDYIRKTNITAKEHGGITQHIGAYQIKHNNQPITFIDTPGHQAFSQMRARGGKAADIVVLVVAADDGVQPQTKEAIKHAQAAGVELIVAINKVDLDTANIEKIKQELASENVLVESWGGDIVAVEVSATTGQGINELLDAIALIGELKNLKSNPDSELEAIIIEAKMERQKGVVVSCIIKNGTLHVSDEVSASGHEAKVKSLMDDHGNMIKEAYPSQPVEILGFKEVPDVGDLIVEKGSELAELAADEERIEIVGLETKKTVNVVVKADTQGTLEAVKASLAELVTENAAADFSIRFISSSTGDILDSDVLKASNTGSVIVGFNVRIKKSVSELADTLSVSVTNYNTIYALLDDIKDLLEGTATKEEAKIRGRAQVLKIFKLESGDIIAGAKVLAGALKPEQNICVYTKNPSDVSADETPAFRGKIKKIKHGKEDADIAGKDTECGILLKPQFDEIEEGMWIEVVK